MANVPDSVFVMDDGNEENEKSKKVEIDWGRFDFGFYCAYSTHWIKIFVPIFSTSFDEYKNVGQIRMIDDDDQMTFNRLSFCFDTTTQLLSCEPH